jgi:hypothetical protein
MSRVVPGGLHAAHGFIKSLTFNGGVGGNIELLRAAFSSPVFGGLKKSSSYSMAPYVLGDME